MTGKHQVGKRIGFFRSRIQRLFRPVLEPVVVPGDGGGAGLCLNEQMRLYSSDVSGVSQLELNSDYSGSVASPSAISGFVAASDSRVVCGQELIEECIRSDGSRRLLLKFCGQSGAQSFEQAFPAQTYSGIGRFESGTYAEVFRGLHVPTGEQVVFKVIRAVPQNLPKKTLKISLRGCETFDDILREVRITRKLSRLDEPHPTHVCPSFPKIFSVKLVSGRIPIRFFEHEIEAGRTSRLSPPRREPFDGYPTAPIEHVVVAMADAGEPLWKMFKEEKVNDYQVLSIAKQVAFALAVAEEAYEFEHRDLHNSNILIRKTSEKFVIFCLNGKSYQIECCGVLASIIDNTFSRYKLNRTVSYKDMTETLRTQSGEKMTLQNKAYIKMVEESGNNWKSYWPRTNVFWLYYLFRTMSNDRVMRQSLEVNGSAAHQLESLITILVKSTSARDAVSRILSAANV